MRLVQARHSSWPQGRSLTSTRLSSSPQMWQGSEPFGSCERAVAAPPQAAGAPQAPLMGPGRRQPRGWRA